MPAASALVVIALLLATMDAVAPGGGFAGKKTDTQLIGSSGATKVLVVGDSVGYGLAVEGIQPIRQELGVAVSNGSYVGCNNLLAIGKVRSVKGELQGPPTSVDCTTNWPAIVEKVRPDVVLMVFGAYPAFSVEVGNTKYTPCQAGYQKAYRTRLLAEAKTLTATGATLVIATTPTTQNGFARAQVPDLDQRVACSNADVKAAAKADPTHVKVVDLAEFVCPQDRCRTTVGGTKLRQDGVHFKGPAAEYIARWITPLALKAADRGG